MTPVLLDPGFRDHLLAIADVSERDLEKLVDELMHHWSETPRRFVRRRHRELQHAGIPTVQSYRLIRAELARRRFAAPELSERQVRRILYG